MDEPKTLRTKLRAALARTPPGIATWGHERSVRFKMAHKAAARAADHPLASKWVLDQALRELESFHKPPACATCHGVGYDSSGQRCEACQP